ncbi:MAG TPA: DHA2 family efflux MFS transporter permease subunit [Acidimicrobiales bacterium]|jgi:EmrB/QacA subfamily drug resistance transporter
MTELTAQRPGTPQGRHPVLTSLIVLTGVFLSSLDLFIVNIAFPSISKNFHGESLSSLSWILSAYTIVFAAALVPAGRWADRAGRKRAFLIGLAVFTASSALCAAAPSLDVLVAARILQATGGALMLPTSLGLLLPAFGPERKGAAIGLWSAVGGAAAAFGPPIGGLLVQASWRWVFLVNLPLSVLALVFGVRILAEVRDPAAHKSDMIGAALLSISVASLVAGIVQGSSWGWGSARIVGAFVVAAAAGTWLVVRSFRHEYPILEPAVIRHRAVALADVSSLVFFGGFGALVLGGVLFLTGVWHESVLRTGFMIAPGPLLAGLTAFPAGLLGARLGHRLVGTVGSLCFAAGGAWWIARVGATPDWLGAYLPGSLVSGFGVGLMLPSLGGAATAPLPPQRFATGSALYAMTRQIGVALGVACLVAILGTATGASAVTAFHHAWYFMLGCGLLSGAILQGIGARTRETADARTVPLDEPPTSLAPAAAYAVVAGK